MILPLRRSALLLVAVLAAAVPALSEENGGATSGNNDGVKKTISVAGLAEYTDPQFEALAAGAKGDPKKVEAINLTKQLFSEAVNDKNQVPEGARFDLKDVAKVGPKVGKILAIVAKFQEMKSRAQTAEDHTRAAEYLKANVHFAEPLLPPVQPPPPPPKTADEKTARPDDRGEHAAPKDKGADLGVLAAHAANQAYQRVEGIGNGPPANGYPGSGGSSNGSTGEPVPGGKTVGDLLGINDPKSPADAMTNARERFRNGDLSGGLSDVSRAIALGGGADAFALRGGMQLEQKRYSDASQDAERALQVDPSNKEALAVAHFAQGRTDGIASGGPSGTPQRGAVPGASGGGFVSGGRAGGAGLSARSGAPSGGAPSEAALSRLSGEQAQKAARSALGMDDLGAAAAFADRALAQDPGNPALLNLRSSIDARRHDYAKAAEDARTGLASAPKDPELRRSLGLAQLRGKDYAGALATANGLLELNPNDPYAYALRGHAYGSLADRDAMLADMERAAELDPRFRPAAAKLAGQLQLPSDKDMLFLFPDEEPRAAADAGAPAGGRSRTFGPLVAGSVLGGLLIALGLAYAVLAPLKERAASALSRITRSGPTVGAAEVDEPRPAPGGELQPGAIRGPYEISRQIGAGGMGLVFAATDRSLGRPVAIKKMREELRYDAREKARFVAEAKTVAALHHPNIVDIYAIAEDGDDVLLVFEYVDGKTVHDLVQASGRLEPDLAAKIVRASADALEYAHSRGVIHRDMKPSNVMLDRSGRVKVMDFGIARMAKDTMLRRSMTNSVVGTPPYMAPEQEQGQARRESDVYSLAVCAYEMLCGRPPFAGIGAGMLLNKINMSFVPPSREIPGLPPALDAVFERAFQADPERRHRTPREFAEALESARLPVARA